MSPIESHGDVPPRATTSRPARLTRQREGILARRIHKHADPFARQELIEAGLPIVYHVARRYRHFGMSPEDLIAEGNLGLIQAVERFDPACGSRFRTYAEWWIREAIRYAILQYGRLIRLPEYLAKRLKAWNQCRNELQNTLQRPPTAEEIRGALGLTERQSRSVLYGLRALIGSTSDLETYAEKRQDDSLVPTSRKHADDLVLLVERLLQQLESPEKDVLELRFGLGENDSLPRTVKDTAAMLGLSPQAVKQMEKEAVRRLRNTLRRTA